MKALVFHGPGMKAWEEVARSSLREDTDAIVRVDATTICGTDLHILKGDVPAMVDGRIIGHEAVGTVEEIGASVKAVAVGDRVLVSCVSACGTCRFCRDGRSGQCTGGASGQLDAQRFVTHRYTFDQFMLAYDTFAAAGESGALKVVLTRT